MVSGKCTAVMMKGLCSILASAMMVLLASNSFAANDHGTHSKYAGEEKRAIKSLSQDDMDELLRGGGWGLAKAAELNGVPGPAHLLELKEDISLSSEQVNRIQSIYDEMKKRAIEQGTLLIELERKLDRQFRENSINEITLRALLKQISDARTELRFTHLRTHLMTPDIISEAQIAQYNQLRGYSDNPCDAVPEGHDAAMWKRHNGCK